MPALRVPMLSVPALLLFALSVSTPAHAQQHTPQQRTSQWRPFEKQAPAAQTARRSRHNPTRQRTSSRELAQWQPFAALDRPRVEQPQATRFDAQVRTVAWDELAGPSLTASPVPRHNAQHHSVLVKAVPQADPFDVTLPEYRPEPQHQQADPRHQPQTDPFEQPLQPNTAGDAEFREEFEDVFDVPMPEPTESTESPEETPEEPTEEPADSSAAEVLDTPDTSEGTIDSNTAPLPPAANDPNEFNRQSQQQLDDELMRDDLEDAFSEPSVDQPEDPSEEFDAEEAYRKLFGSRAGSNSSPSAGDEEQAIEAEQHRQELARQRVADAENCREEFSRLRSSRIDSIDLNIRVTGEPGQDFPNECGLGDDLFAARQWPQITYMWKASGLCHKPLYFEQVQLERYGHSWGPYVQPLMSGVHFFGSVPILPYKMGIRTPNECVYTLGYYRPGSCAPYMIDAVPFTWRAAFFQGMTTAGAAVAIP